MKAIVKSVIVVLLYLGLVGCEFRPFEPTGYIEPTRESQAVSTLVPEPETGTPSLEINPQEVKPDETVALAGSDFTPGGAVIWFFVYEGGGIVFGLEGKADANGFFEANFAGMSPYAHAGSWTAAAIDEATGRVAEAALTLVSSLTPDESIQFDQMGVALGESNAFTASGFDAKEGLTVKIIRPDGSEIEYDAYADENGKLIGTVSVAEDRPVGTYTLTVSGKSSGHEAQGWFAVDDGVAVNTTIYWGERSWWNPLAYLDDQPYKVLEFPICTPTEIHLGDLLESSIAEITNCLLVGQGSGPGAPSCTITPDGKLFIHLTHKVPITLAVKFAAWRAGGALDYRWVYIHVVGK